MDRSLIVFRSFKDFPQVKAFTTLKNTIAGETKPRYTGTPEVKTWENRKKLAEILKIDAGQLVFPRQSHTNSVAYLAKEQIEELKDTDALITNQPGICLCVQTADCVPVLLFDPVTEAIGAVHAGWRGTVKLIVKEVISNLKDRFSSDPKDIRAVIGPSIGPEKYEVGNEVADAVKRNIPNPGHSLKIHPSGKFHLNLWEANRQVMLECGILPGNIEISGYCTYSQHDYFFSARREGIETGRLVSGIMLFR